MSIQTDDFEPVRRVVSAAPASPNEEAIERALRPKGLAEYVGLDAHAHIIPVADNTAAPTFARMFR